MFEPSQWETALQCNIISHWRGAFTKWSLWASCLEEYISNHMLNHEYVIVVKYFFLQNCFAALWIHGYWQDCSISSANALEIPQSCSKPSKCLCTTSSPSLLLRRIWDVHTAVASFVMGPWGRHSLFKISFSFFLIIFSAIRQPLLKVAKEISRDTMVLDLTLQYRWIIIILWLSRSSQWFGP